MTTTKLYSRNNIGLFINFALVIISLLTIYSGFVMQAAYHAGGKPHEVVSAGFNYFQWSTIHKIIIVVFSILIIFHTVLHLKWYRGLFTKPLPHAKRQTVILSVIFFIVAATGYFAWVVSSSNQHLRKIFIELHDKLVIILIIYLIIHIVKRFRWFVKQIKG